MKTIAFLIFIAFAAASCSTIIQGSKQEIKIKSLTTDARIQVDGVDVTTASKDTITLKLKRNDNHVITISKEGYETKSITLEKHNQAGFVVVDIVLACTGFGLVFIIVDAATGSWNNFKMDKVVVTLEPKK